ncbi:PREDICTED: mitochondrial import inner membrane translocase subunit Tim21 [Dufourea novaeangliae]|uniref:Mitochondrial import inner membrane translocase subunit Tim21 n=1 Tax=Dufourea novaeangliae TaxID=178035 RepID=A0A154P368_DUFNO|nr:PREDICTED: mitochondrial import inner membrane translocase subunit Tim21 [Dufourea novaeangliae]KZC06375.1 Mitochondrial import inner membrane translocase subunit Tim21 [Dufourea novaeangliae]
MASVRVIKYISYKRLVTISGLTNARILSYDLTPNIQQSILFSTKRSIARANVVEEENKVQVGFAGVVKESTKSIGYLSIILSGIGLTGFMLYVIFYELFSSKSPNGIYGKALEDCKKDSRVINALGEPIKAYGEESRRGRRTHVSHTKFVKDGLKHMRMRFYIQGIRRRGTVILEVQENEFGNYLYRYLYVLVDDIMQTVIKIEDNRDEYKSPSTGTDFELS